MKTKLILVEGLPSSGKSTTAKLVKEILDNNKIQTELYEEGNIHHPADYDGVAFFGKDDFHQLMMEFQGEGEKIQEIAIKKDTGYLVEYKKGIVEKKIKFSKEVCNQFFKNDIYELPLGLHMNLLRERWRGFAEKAQQEEKVYIFDCPFIQNPITVSMIRSNAKKEEVMGYIKSLEGIIKGLNPVVVYLEQEDIEESFKKAIEERPKEWLGFFIDYYTKQGYGKAHQLKGLDGTIEVLKTRRDLEDAVLEKLDIDSYSIDNTNKDFKRLRNDIEEVLKNYI